MCQIWPLNLLQGQTGVNHLKSAKTRLLLVLEVWDVKSTYRKPCPANIFDVSHLTFNPSFKVRLGSTILKVRKTHLFLEVWDVKSTFTMSCESSGAVKFGPSFKVKLGSRIFKRHAYYFITNLDSLCDDSSLILSIQHSLISSFYYFSLSFKLSTLRDAAFLYSKTIF